MDPTLRHDNSPATARKVRVLRDLVPAALAAGAAALTVTLIVGGTTADLGKRAEDAALAPGLTVPSETALRIRPAPARPRSAVRTDRRSEATTTDDVLLAAIRLPAREDGGGRLDSRTGSGTTSVAAPALPVAASPPPVVPSPDLATVPAVPAVLTVAPPTAPVATRSRPARRSPEAPRGVGSLSKAVIAQVLTLRSPADPGKASDPETAPQYESADARRRDREDDPHRNDAGNREDRQLRDVEDERAEARRDH